MALVESIMWDSEPKKKSLKCTLQITQYYVISFDYGTVQMVPMPSQEGLQANWKKLSAPFIIIIAASDWGVPVAVQTRK